MLAVIAAVVMLITLISACFMPSSQVWEIFKVLYWRNGIGLIIIVAAALPITIYGFAALTDADLVCSMDDDQLASSMMIVEFACIIFIGFMSLAITVSKLTIPVYGDVSVTNTVSSKYLTKSKQITSNHYQQVDGDTFIINGHKYSVANSHQVKMNISDTAKTSITVTDYNFKKSTPKWVIEYADHTESLPSKNQSDYRRVLITGRAIK